MVGFSKISILFNNLVSGNCFPLMETVIEKISEKNRIFQLSVPKEENITSGFANEGFRNFLYDLPIFIVLLMLCLCNFPVIALTKILNASH